MRTHFVLVSMLCVVAMVAVPHSVLSATWYIKADGTGEVKTIQDGVDAAADGDTLLLAPGTFTGRGNRKIDFNVRRIVLTSELGAPVTIIDCEGQQSGIKIDSGQGVETVISGITITNGDAGAKDGGGIFIDNASPTIIDNILTNCLARCGGGIMVKNVSAPIIERNTIVGNAANDGGGIFAEGSTPLVSHNVIAFNTAGGGFGCQAGAAPVYGCNVLFANVGGDSVACGVDLGTNISTDPEFCGIAGSGNLFLQSDSPCAPGMSPCLIQIGALGVNCGSVATYRRTWGGMKAIFR